MINYNPFISELINKGDSKIGNTKDQNTRESTYKVNNPNFKEEFLDKLKKYFCVKEQRIRFNKPENDLTNR